MPLNGPTGCFGLLLLDRVNKRPSVKADQLIYSTFIAMSGQCTSMAIIISNKIDFSFSVYIHGGFLQIQSHLNFKIMRLYVCLENRFQMYIDKLLLNVFTSK